MNGFTKLYKEERELLRKINTGAAYEVYMHLKDKYRYYDKDVYSYIKYMAEYLEMSERTIIRAIKKLKEVGLIECRRGWSKDEGAPNSCNYYSFPIVDMIEKSEPEKEETPKKKERHKKDNKTENKVDVKQFFKDYLCSDNIEINTLNYIHLFLSIDSINSIDKFKIINTDEKWRAIQMDRYNVNENYIRNYIKSMDYHEFLKTPWWNAVRDYKRKREDNTCKKCGCTDKTLHIHHPNYEIRGYEDKYIDTLQCLCEDCHKEAHSKKKEIDEEFIKSIMLD